VKKLVILKSKNLKFLKALLAVASKDFKTKKKKKEKNNF
jgi:hypothetical protein